MEILFFWTICAAIVGFFAHSRGRSGLGFFLLSILLSPLLGVVVVLVMSNKVEEEKRQRRRREDHELQIESVRAIASRPQQVAIEASSPKKPETTSVADELEKLAALRDKGVLTDEEFLSQKNALLATR